MKPIEELGPQAEVLGFFRDYMLRGVKNLNTKERAVYTEFLRQMTMQRYVVDPSKINLNDLAHSNRPGAIVRRKP